MKLFKRTIIYRFYYFFKLNQINVSSYTKQLVHRRFHLTLLRANLLFNQTQVIRNLTLDLHKIKFHVFHFFFFAKKKLRKTSNRKKQIPGFLFVVFK